MIGRGVDGECCVIEICEEVNVDCDGGKEAMDKIKTSNVKPNSKPTLSSNILIYPNPTEGGMTVEFNQHKIGEVSLYLLNMNGKEVKVLMEAEEIPSGKYSKQYNDIDLPSGIYLLQMIKNGETEMSKIMIK